MTRRRDSSTARITDFSASLEVGPDGWCMVWVPELPGLFVNEPSKKRALRLLPGAIGGYLRWLRRHAEPVTLLRTVRVVPRERHVVRPAAMGLVCGPASV
jgi:hypothetical protein